MSKKTSSKFTEAFKQDVLRQIAQGDYSIAEVGRRMGIPAKTLYAWRERSKGEALGAQPHVEPSMEISKLRAELRRVTEERDILKKAGPPRPRRTLQSCPCKVRLHQRSPTRIPRDNHVLCAQGAQERVLCLARQSALKACPKRQRTVGDDSRKLSRCTRRVR